MSTYLLLYVDINPPYPPATYHQDYLIATLELGIIEINLYVSVFNIYLFIWLTRVLVAARKIFTARCRIFHCGVWTL